jgi:hypothetical protein
MRRRSPVLMRAANIIAHSPSSQHAPQEVPLGCRLFRPPCKPAPSSACG